MIGTVTDAIAEVQAQIGRADTKASILTGLSLAALTGGTALTTKIHLHGVALAAAVLTAALICGALLLLGTAIRPNLCGNYGFVHWAATPVERLHDELLGADTPWERTERHFDHLRYLRQLAQSTQAKYRRIRLAVDLLGAALATAGLTAILTGLGW